MTPCHVVQFTTPKRYLLNGLWFGPKEAKRVIVWVHGLGSSAFSMHHVISMLPDNKTAVLAFNNRGHDKVSTVKRAVGKKQLLAGAAHEVFTDSTDDIAGAVAFARHAGAREIFLAGHSTGCQKSIYWASKKAGQSIRGIILLAPVSDWAAATRLNGHAAMSRATSIARRLVLSGKTHELLPSHVWNSTIDAQRFLSLCTPDSQEEIFSYAQTEKVPTLLRRVRAPVLVLWAGKDEYANLSPKKIAAWFDDAIRSPHRVVVVPNVGHGFKGKEAMVVQEMRAFMKETVD